MLERLKTFYRIIVKRTLKVHLAVILESISSLYNT